MEHLENQNDLLRDPCKNPTDFFSIISPLDKSVYLEKEKDYGKQKSKNLLCVKKENIISKIHESILEEDFTETLQLFQSNALNLPEYIDDRFLEPVFRYFYLREIKNTHFQDVLELFKIAHFLKVSDLIKAITDFLLKPLNSKVKAIILFKKTLDFVFSEKEQHQEIYYNIIQTSGNYLLENSFYDDFLNIFNSDLFKKGHFVSESLDFV